MSKLYKATIYIDDINNTYENLEDLRDDIESLDVSIDFDNIIEVDTTKYIDEVEDEYPWNTVDSKVRVYEIEKFLKEKDNG